jgi:DNA-binding transcriptional LysR family regulator
VKPHEIASRGANRDLDLRALRCLLVLGEAGHYGRAAERLHMSQPGLSRAIAVLEGRVGACLVERDARPLRLSREGEVLAWHARRLLAEQQAAFQHLAATALVDSGRPRDSTDSRADNDRPDQAAEPLAS